MFRPAATLNQADFPPHKTRQFSLRRVPHKALAADPNNSLTLINALNRPLDRWHGIYIAISAVVLEFMSRLDSRKEPLMFRALAIALGAFILAGCSTSASVQNPFKSDDTQKTQLAAFAAQAQYPNKQA